MADFTALKTAIQNAIKQNGNNAITGNLLQDILISMVSTLGDSAINGLSSSLSTETTNRQNADGALQSAINTINTKLSDGYTYLGIATPTTNPSTTSGKVFYIATTAGTYTNFRNSSSQPLVLTQGINFLKYNGTSWSVEQVWGVDDVPTAMSNNLIKSGGVQNELALGAVYDVSAKNPTAGPDNDGKWESLSALLSDANLNTLIPTSVRKGGMSIKYVCSSDNNYVQYRLKKNEWSIRLYDWIKISNTSNLDMQLLSIADYVLYDKYWNTAGSIGDGTNYRCLQYKLPITEDFYYNFIGGTNLTVRCFDSSNTYINNADIDTTNNKVTVLEGTKTVAIYWQKSSDSNSDNYSNDWFAFTSLPKQIIKNKKDINDINSAITSINNSISSLDEKTFSDILQINSIESFVVKGKYWDSAGHIQTAQNYSCIDKPILVYGDLYYNLQGGNFLNCRCLDASKVLLGSATIDTDKKKITLIEDTKYVLLYWQHQSEDYSKDYVTSALNIKQIFDNKKELEEEISDLSTEIADVEDYLEKIPKKFFKNCITFNDIFVDNEYYSSNGNTYSANTYARTGLISAKANKYAVYGFSYGGAYCFDSNDEFLGRAVYSNGVFTLLENTAKFGLNFQKALQPEDYQNGMIFNLEPFVGIEDHNNIANLNTRVTALENQTQGGNILDGKKWCVVGDSFSEWSDEKFTSGIYNNKYKTYKFFIALRNNMVIQDLTLSGRTMAYPNDHTFNNAFAKPELYQSIASDADYITIQLGINDIAHVLGESQDSESVDGDITVGTIDSTDTGTFYGAWNVVMQWIFENRPNAHVGIIITNGLGGNGPTGTYSTVGMQIYTAIKDIVRKWNVPYIDLNGGDGKTPMMQRGIYPEGTPAALIAAKWNAFATSPTEPYNGHTNATGHLYESTFIENFLRSL